jgi:hypothetical protein
MVVFISTSCQEDFGGKKDQTSSSSFQRKEENISEKDILLINCDTVYSEKGYFIELAQLGMSQTQDYENNTIFKFSRRDGNYTSPIHIDSIYSHLGQVKFQDYNQDGIKDILIQNISDVRSNWTYNLYLVDLKKNKLNYLQGFNEIKNPRLIEESNIIES